MKEIVEGLIADFHERPLPTITSRHTAFPLLKGKANVAIGMRRSGKTYFCYQRMLELLEQGLDREKLLYLNFEDERLFGFQVTDFQTILDVYYARHPEFKSVECHIFFDEIQCVPEWQRFIRRLLDTENVKLYLTGSSSKLLSTEIATSLRGRSMSVEIFPFSFSEYLVAAGIFKVLPVRMGSQTVARLRNAVATYLEQGGFPEVLTYEVNDRIHVLQSYVDSVVLRDVIERHGAVNLLALRHLVAQVMAAPGSVFSVNKFYNSLRSMQIKCTKNALYGYVDYLVDAYLLQRVPLHTRSERMRMTNPPKLYPIDTGLANAMGYRNSANMGPLLETLAFLHLRRSGNDIEYVRTQDGYECDFIVRDRISGEFSLFQVCWDMSEQTTYERELRGLRSAMTQYGIGCGTIVTWDTSLEVDSQITAVPFWRWASTSQFSINSRAASVI